MSNFHGDNPAPYLRESEQIPFCFRNLITGMIRPYFMVILKKMHYLIDLQITGVSLLRLVWEVNSISKAASCLPETADRNASLGAGSRMHMMAAADNFLTCKCNCLHKPFFAWNISVEAFFKWHIGIWVVNGTLCVVSIRCRYSISWWKRDGDIYSPQLHRDVIMLTRWCSFYSDCRHL